MTTAGSTQAPDPVGQPSRRWRILWIAIAAGLTAVVAFAALSVPWKETFTAIGDAHPGWLLLALVANGLILPFWALQWKWLAPARHPASLSTYFEITALYSACKTAIPMTGLPSALALLIAIGRLPPGAAISVLALDQLVTGIVKLLLIAAAFALAPLPFWMRSTAVTLLALVVAALLALLALAHASHAIRRLVLGLDGFTASIARHIAAWADHLEPLRNGPRAMGVLGLAILKKLIEIAAALVVQQACGIPISLDTAVLVVAALSVMTMLPAAPAHIGVYEATVVFIYQSAGIPPATALAAAVLQHAAELLSAFGIGALAVVLGHRRRV